MKRRDFLANNVLTAGALAARPGLRRAGALLRDSSRRPAARMIAPDFMGLGYEISSVARPGLLSPANKVYVQLVRTLGARGVIRIGGNTADYAHYSERSRSFRRARNCGERRSAARSGQLS